MNKILLLFFTAAFFMVSCQNQGNGKDSKPAKTDSATKSTTASSGSEDLEQKVEAFGKLVPKTKDELMALLPETFMGGQRGMVSSGTVMGVVQANANYAVNDTINVYIGISDCGGSAGAGNYSNVMTTLQAQVGESGEGTIREITIGKTRGFEKFDKAKNTCMLWFLGGDRYLVTAGGNVAASELHQAAAGLKF